MVVKMMKWRRGREASKKYEAKMVVHEVRGVVSSECCRESFSMEIKWRGLRKGIGLRGGRSSSGVRRNFTKEVCCCLREDDDGDGVHVVRWDDEFRCVCSFEPYHKHKDKDQPFFHPWEVSFTLVNGSKQGTKNNVPNIVGTANLNLAEFADKQHTQINVPLATRAAGVDTRPVATPSLHLSIALEELRNADEPCQVLPRPILSFPRSPCYGEMFISSQKQDKVSPKRVNNIFKGLSSLRAKTTVREQESSDGRSSEDIDFSYPLDIDSLDDSDEGDDSDEVKDDSRVGKPFNYGTLAYANHAGASTFSNTTSREDEDWIHYSHCQSEGVRTSHRDTRVVKRGIIPWRKRKLSFRSSPKVKGEPLLKRYYGEEGGDDIDFDRRQLSSSDESSLKRNGDNSVAASAFGDDNFAVGVWEHKEIVSRDGQMKLKTQVFFASIDQRNERAAGESACTALVAVIADWFQSNHDEMPIKSQLDTLIREGSLAWRNLCENENYRERFPDKHFDLETVLEAKIRPLSVVPQKSFIGFFQPQGLEDDGFDFLQGAMSFDNIWDEIFRCASEMQASTDPLVYIISWNDHFFVLKVEHDAYYIIDTLGERLYEGCNQAFILKFDRDTTINRISNENETRTSGDKHDDDDKSEQNLKDEEGSTGNDVMGKNEQESIVVSMGKESCKEYIKSFLAEIPIRELEVDVKKGLMTSTPLHHRLQIEFHYTSCVHECADTDTGDLTIKQD